MKRTIIAFLLVFASANSVAQNLDFYQQKKLDKIINHDKKIYGEEYVNSKKYTISNNGTLYANSSPIIFTTVYEKNETETAVFYNKEKKYSLTGKWTLFNIYDYDLKYYVTHCPAFFNEDKIIMEYSVYDSKQKKRSSYEILANIKKIFEKSNHADINGFRIVKHDSINNYCLYKKKESNIETNEVQDVYYLLGSKNRKIFKIALSNFKEEDYEDLDKFLVDCYIRN